MEMRLRPIVRSRPVEVSCVASPSVVVPVELKVPATAVLPLASVTVNIVELTANVVALSVSKLLPIADAPVALTIVFAVSVELVTVPTAVHVPAPAELIDVTAVPAAHDAPARFADTVEPELVSPVPAVLKNVLHVEVPSDAVAVSAMPAEHDVGVRLMLTVPVVVIGLGAQDMPVPHATLVTVPPPPPPVPVPIFVHDVFDDPLL